MVHAIKRVSHHRPQAHLDAAQREQLPAQAFRLLKKPADPPLILVDDVVTTGSTLKRAAEALMVDDEQLRLFALARVP